MRILVIIFELTNGHFNFLLIQYNTLNNGKSFIVTASEIFKSKVHERRKLFSEPDLFKIKSTKILISDKSIKDLSKI